MGKLFDLNIEQVLEHWELKDALREIIANAIDEQQLTETKDIEIFEDSQNRWHIRDHGRGLEYVHLTQNENKEKLSSENLIGKFGVGLKDALAVFNRHNVHVTAYSKHSTMTLSMSEKSGFNLETLHAEFKEPEDTSMVGTEFIIGGVSVDDIEKAKNMFLKFSNLNLLESTKYGEVYEAKEEFAYIYVNGVKVASEDNFLFSYNITNISTSIKRALNRERSNVGRSAYSNSVKKILTQCKTNAVLTSLVKDLYNVMYGTNKDESSWIDVSQYAAETLNKNNNIVFMTSYERSNLTNEEVEVLEESGKELMLVTDSLKEKLSDRVTAFSDVMVAYRDSFEYSFISYKQLTSKEKKGFNRKNIVINFLKKQGYKCNIPVLISETIRISEFGTETHGVYERENNQIIIKRDIIATDKFLGTLIHEFAHYISGAPDNTREFETCLTNLLGHAMNEKILMNQPKKRRLLKGLFRR